MRASLVSSPTQKYSSFNVIIISFRHGSFVQPPSFDFHFPDQFPPQQQEGVNVIVAASSDVSSFTHPAHHFTCLDGAPVSIKP